MTAADAVAPAASGRPRESSTLAYILAIWALAVVLELVAWKMYGPPTNLGFLVALVALVVANSLLGVSTLEARVQFAAGHLVVLAAIAIVGPSGAWLVGLSESVLTRGLPRLRVRLFNMAMWACVATLGGLVYTVVGGIVAPTALRGVGPLMRWVGLPLVLADVVQAIANAVLLAGVMKVAQGIPARVQVVRLLTSTGLSYIGYGIVAFLLVVLWLPAGLGPFSIVLILAPLLGAWWAYRQYGDELEARERTLDVLVAAIETKAPHLEGHSARVAALSAAIAEELGMRPQEVRDARTAGMLHDIGQVALPVSVVLEGGRKADVEFETYPGRGAHMLRELSFLAGALDGIAHHRDESRGGVLAAPWPLALSVRVVHVADSFDLLTRVGQDAEVVSPETALVNLRLKATHDDARIVDALATTLARRPERTEP